LWSAARVAALLSILALLAVCGCSATRARGSAVIYGEGHTFSLSAPRGWVLDNEAGRDQGVTAVFYPLDSSWAEAGEVMYVSTVPKLGNPELQALMDEDLDRQHIDSPTVQMHASDPLPIADGTLAPVNDFAGDAWGNRERIAYIDGGDVWVMLVLTARTEEGFLATRSAFAEVVRSFRVETKP
jgi:hypothetical protein